MKIHSSPHLFYCNTLLHVKPDMTLHYFSVKLKIKKSLKNRVILQKKIPTKSYNSHCPEDGDCVIYIYTQ